MVTLSLVRFPGPSRLAFFLQGREGAVGFRFPLGRSGGGFLFKENGGVRDGISRGVANGAGHGDYGTRLGCGSLREGRCRCRQDQEQNGSREGTQRSREGSRVQVLRVSQAVHFWHFTLQMTSCKNGFGVHPVVDGKYAQSSEGTGDRDATWRM